MNVIDHSILAINDIFMLSSAHCVLDDECTFLQPITRHVFMHCLIQRQFSYYYYHYYYYRFHTNYCPHYGHFLCSHGIWHYLSQSAISLLLRQCAHDGPARMAITFQEVARVV